MAFSVYIDTSNAAFEHSLAAELARTLHGLAYRFEIAGTEDEGNLLDVNGNFVGKWWFLPDGDDDE